MEKWLAALLYAVLLLSVSLFLFSSCLEQDSQELRFREELARLQSAECGLNKLDPSEIRYGEAYIDGTWSVNSYYDTSGLIKVPVGETVICMVFPGGIYSLPTMNNAVCRGISLLNPDGTVYSYSDGVYFVTNKSDETKYARVCMWSESFPECVSTIREIVVMPLFGGSNPVYTDSRPYEEYVRYVDDSENDDSLTLEKLVNSEVETRYASITNLTFGYVDKEGIKYHEERVCTVAMTPVKKGDVIAIDSEGIAMSVTEYDENKSFVSVSRYLSKSANTQYRSGVYHIKHDGFARMHFLSIENRITLDSVADGFRIIRTDDLQSNRIAINKYTGNTVMVSRKPTLSDIRINGQDGTFVGDRLWSFDDGTTGLGSIKIIDTDEGILETRSHNLGHMNCVDYNGNNDSLITLGGSGWNRPELIIYRNPESSYKLLKTDENCCVIPLFNGGFSINSSGSVCWGESDCFAYFMTGFYANDADDVSPTVEIYKILLGMGDNDVSSSGYGTFKSGMAETEYNGTCRIIKTYYGVIINGIDTVFDSTKGIGTPQGMTFDGHLYVGWGTRGHNFLKIALDSDAERFTVVCNYMYHHYLYDGTEELYEPEMVAVKGNSIYCGSVTNDGKTLFTIMSL